MLKEGRLARGLERIVEAGRNHRQLGLYLYLLERGESTLEELARVYTLFTGRRVTPETVKTQMRLLEVKGLVEKSGDRYRAVSVPAESLPGLFDIKRARAGRIGGERRLCNLLTGLPTIRSLPPRLRDKIRRVVETAKTLVERGDRETALDLLVHTLLPVRETGVLWLWWRDTFIYYERKTMAAGSFHTVKHPVLANLLRELGFTEGVLSYHTLGDSRRHLKRIFGEENTYPYARSVFYSLKALGLVNPGPQYVVDLEYNGEEITLVLRDLHGNTLQVFTHPWTGPPPPPLREEGDRRVAVTLGVQHVKKANESAYFSYFLGNRGKPR